MNNTPIVKIEPTQANGFLYRMAEPICFAIFLNFVFELSYTFTFGLSFSFWLFYFAFRIVYLNQNNHYEPLLTQSKAKYKKLYEESADFITWAEAEIQLKNEGIASLAVQYKALQGEKEQLNKRIDLLQNGKELTNARWEVSRLEKELSDKVSYFEKQVSQLNQQVTQLEKQLTQKNEQVSTLQNQVSTLQGERLAYKEVSDAREITKLKQSFHALLDRGDNLTKLAEVVNELEKRGISPESLCNTAEKLSHWEVLKDKICKFINN
jgi:chromosome segregation ATPase